MYDTKTTALNRPLSIHTVLRSSSSTRDNHPTGPGIRPYSQASTCGPLRSARNRGYCRSNTVNERKRSWMVFLSPDRSQLE
ncbi:hypothetical protein LZ554_001867 [Drepanopeziza brunnea f. sp. 'monogermtubi']|nr:hypothetical protein LZ554_001867 [Drepanopeziza brunnea f. sp. 'monogermtubi']